MAKVSGEMVRPIVTHGDWGGFDVEMLRIGALARTVLVRLKCPAVVVMSVRRHSRDMFLIARYLHVCSPVYCLKDR